MSFTDEDIKKLKERIGECSHWPNGGVTTSLEYLESLLARLEAAETFIDAHAKKLRLDCEPGCTFYEAWRKACGFK